MHLVTRLQLPAALLVSLVAGALGAQAAPASPAPPACSPDPIQPVRVENEIVEYSPSSDFLTGSITQAALAAAQAGARTRGTQGWQIAAVNDMGGKVVVGYTRLNSTARDAQLNCLQAMMKDSLTKIHTDVLRAVRLGLMRPLTDDERRDFVNVIGDNVMRELRRQRDSLAAIPHQAGQRPPH